MKDFSVKVNLEALSNVNTQEGTSDDDMNKIMSIQEKILEVFEEDEVDMFTAYMILLSMADSIYVSSVLNDIEVT